MANGTIKVTIGIPCHNAARWLVDAVESALGQTWANKEVLVVDDASTDDSPKILAGYGDRLRVLREERRRGANHARNRILREMAGDWLQYVDADDYLGPDKVARQMAVAAADPAADVIYGPVWVRDQMAETDTLAAINPRYDLFSQWLAWQLPPVGGCLWRRQALANIGGWDEAVSCCEEEELYLRAVQAGLEFRYDEAAGAVYRVWSEGTQRRRDAPETIRVKTALIDDLHRWLNERGLWMPHHSRIAGRACFEMARKLAATGLWAGRKYHADRYRQRLIYLEGPSAPAVYRFCHWFFGFTGAELLDRWWRRLRQIRFRKAAVAEPVVADAAEPPAPTTAAAPVAAAVGSPGTVAGAPPPAAGPVAADAAAPQSDPPIGENASGG